MTPHPDKLTARKSGPLTGRVKVPGDKSVSHRALILAALSIGETHIRGLLESDDVLATARALSLLGVTLSQSERDWRVHGVGVGGLAQPDGPIDFGNSGTGARLMMGAIAGQAISARLTGDVSLCQRPMNRVLKPLLEMGARIEGGEDGTLPFTLVGTDDLAPIRYRLPVPSAQVKSAVLLAGLHAPGKTTVIERQATRDHTERMLTHFGAQMETSAAEDGARAITVTGEVELSAHDVEVPGDPSSAAFACAAALVIPGSHITIEGVMMNPTRSGLYETLNEMGADIAFANERVEGGEQVGDMQVRASALTGITVPAGRAPSMIDEYPVLAVLAAYARGETRMEGLGELRVKESDRLAAIADGLAACGVDAAIDGDALIVRGGDGAVRGGGIVKTHMDHRIAMSFLVLGLAADKPVTVDDGVMIATSFPGFTGLMTGLGARIENS